MPRFVFFALFWVIFCFQSLGSPEADWRDEAGWRAGASLPSALPDAVAARDGAKLYVMSGALGAGMRPFFELYDLRGDGWRPLTPIPRLASRFALAVGGGRVFVTGGVDATSKTTRGFWMYAPETAIWVELGALPKSRAGHVSLVADNQLFVLGGLGEDVSRVLSYDLQNRQWRVWSQAMPVSVTGAAMARRGDDIILAGGSNARGRDVADVQAFNIKTGKWRRLPPLPQASSGGALLLLKGRLHYIGGYSQRQQKVLATHVRLQGKKWLGQPPLTQGRHRMGYASDGQKIVLIGGALGGGFYALFTGSDGVSIYQPND